MYFRNIKQGCKPSTQVLLTKLFVFEQVLYVLEFTLTFEFNIFLEKVFA